MKFLKIIFGIIMSAVCFYLAARHIDFLALKESFNRINIFWMLFSSAGAFISQWVRSKRWARLLKPIHPVDNRKSFEIYSVGTMTNLIIPLRGGDVLRAWLMAQYLSRDKSSILATVVTERLMDLIFFGILVGLSLLLYPLPEWVTGAGLFLFLSSLGLGVFFALLKMEKISLRLLWKFFSILMPERIVVKLQGIFTGFIEGLAPLATTREYVFFLLETILIWVTQGVFIYLLFYSFDFTETYHLSGKAALLILALTSVALTVPSAPSYAGTLHLMIVIALEICGVPLTEAFSYAIVFHAINTLKGIILGVYGGLMVQRFAYRFSSKYLNNVLKAQ
jgi:hypothetical protein